MEELVVMRKLLEETLGREAKLERITFSPLPLRRIREDFRAELIAEGEKAAEAIVEAAAKGPFLSQDDFRERTKVSKTVVDKLVELGILKGLPESNQLSLFDLVS